MKVIGFSPKLATHFEQINRHWIEAYFEMESLDEELLLNPQREIIDKGGDVLFVEENDQILGVVALKKHNHVRIELTKMGVYEDFRNRGAGKFLIESAISRARKMGFKSLILYSNRKLKNAIHLYRKMGFQELECTDAEYSRCDIQMELKID